jgi:salicylate hydroxylase
MLYKLATSTGTKVTYDASVTTVSVDEDAQTARALLANGEIMEADIIIGADGYRSTVRDVVTNRDNEGTPSGTSVLT